MSLLGAGHPESQQNGVSGELALESITSPSSFRLEIEEFAREYESLHAFSQALLKENHRLRGDSGDLTGTSEEFLPDADIPSEMNPTQHKYGNVSDLNVEALCVVPREITDDQKQQMQDIRGSSMQYNGTEAVTNTFDLDYDSVSENSQSRDHAPMPIVAKVSSMVSMSSMKTGEGQWISERISDQTVGAAGLFPKWFDPGFTKTDETDAGPSPSLAVSDEAGPQMSYLGIQYDMDGGEVADDCTVSPVSSVRLTWDFFAFVCLIVELWITPFELVFLEECEPPQAFSIISYMITAFFACDILLNFFTGFVEGDRTIMKRRLIFLNYIRLWFWIDLIATVPFELLLNAASGGAMSVARLGKASKVVKTLRYLKLLRIARLVKVARKAAQVGAHFRIFAGMRSFFLPIQVSLFLMVYAHIHGCIWAFLQPEWVAVDNPGAGLELYFESFWWAFTAVTAGSVGFVGTRELRTHHWSIFLFEMIITSERLILVVLGSRKILVLSLRFVDQARVSNARMDVLHYLRKNKVSFETQIQVMFYLTDASKVQSQQRLAKNMSEEPLPRELHRTICKELWNHKLMTLGMIAEISKWHACFTAELAQSVQEETLPSKALLLKAGDPAIAAYYILDGVLLVKDSPGRDVPNFKIGMWVGENALVSSLLRCPATFVTIVMTSVMCVNGEAFQDALTRYGLIERFQAFCGQTLWRGLCGRCGALGDHFSDSCMAGIRRKSIIHERVSKWGEALSQPRPNVASIEVRESAQSKQSHEESHVRAPSRDLKKFLTEVSLTWISPTLQNMEIYDLRDLEQLDKQELRQSLNTDLSQVQERALSAEEIQKFRERQASSVHRALFATGSHVDHLIFLSHYKLEAGTEAALLRTEIEQAIEKDPASLGHRFDAPVFLDSDDLNNLEELQKRVRNTHNLVLLLTAGVLTRPWVLIEILTAWEEGICVQPVIITKPGTEFKFPDEAFYTSLRTGGVLDLQAIDVIQDHGFTMGQLELAVRNAFQQIAVPYSPHKPKNIRQAEVDKLMKNCRLKGDDEFITHRRSASDSRGTKSLQTRSSQGSALFKGSTPLF